jgi:predicted transcriptional regulator
MTVTVNTPKRRDKLVIMTEIIAIAKKGTSKTHIMFKASLSFSQLNEYLTLLRETGLLVKTTNDGKEIYTPTEKGIWFVEKQCQLIKLVNENVSKNHVKTMLPLTYVFQRSEPFTNQPSIKLVNSL